MASCNSSALPPAAASHRCCRCNKSAKCVRCACARSREPCSCCLPGDFGRCHNLHNRSVSSEPPSPESDASPALDSASCSVLPIPGDGASAPLPGTSSQPASSSPGSSSLNDAHHPPWTTSCEPVFQRCIMSPRRQETIGPVWLVMFSLLCVPQCMTIMRGANVLCLQGASWPVHPGEDDLTGVRF